MKPSSKYFDSIRISANKKKTPQEEAPQCQWEGCDKPGTHKAPAGRGHEGEYMHFCIQHVREYNKNFNYFSGLDKEAIAKFQKDAITGHRPTWSTSSNGTNRQARVSSDFSSRRSGSAAYQNRLRDPFSLFNEETRRARTPTRRVKTLEAKAFATLGLETSVSGDEIKTRYKMLVKKHHPDANGGDRTSEERFREVLQAYNLLKQSGYC